MYILLAKMSGDVGLLEAVQAVEALGEADGGGDVHGLGAVVERVQRVCVRLGACVLGRGASRPPHTHLFVSQLLE